MKKVSKSILVITKIIEVMQWLAALICIGTLVITLIKPDMTLSYVNDAILNGGSIAFGNFTYTVEGFIKPLPSPFVLSVICISYMLIAILFGLIFNLTYRILKGFSTLQNGEYSPFKISTASNLKLIGNLLFVTFGLTFISEVIISIVSDFALQTVNANLMFLFLGLIVHSIAHIFEYGAALQDDVDGLV